MNIDIKSALMFEDAIKELKKYGRVNSELLKFKIYNELIQAYKKACASRHKTRFLKNLKPLKVIKLNATSIKKYALGLEDINTVDNELPKIHRLKQELDKVGAFKFNAFNDTESLTKRYTTIINGKRAFSDNKALYELSKIFAIEHYYDFSSPINGITSIDKFDIRFKCIGTESVLIDEQSEKNGGVKASEKFELLLPELVELELDDLSMLVLSLRMHNKTARRLAGNPTNKTITPYIQDDKQLHKLHEIFTNDKKLTDLLEDKFTHIQNQQRKVTTENLNIKPKDIEQEKINMIWAKFNSFAIKDNHPVIIRNTQRYELDELDIALGRSVDDFLIDSLELSKEESEPLTYEFRVYFQDLLLFWMERGYIFTNELSKIKFGLFDNISSHQRTKHIQGIFKGAVKKQKKINGKNYKVWDLSGAQIRTFDLCDNSELKQMRTEAVKIAVNHFISSNAGKTVIDEALRSVLEDLNEKYGIEPNEQNQTEVFEIAEDFGVKIKYSTKSKDQGSNQVPF